MLVEEMISHGWLLVLCLDDCVGNCFSFNLSFAYLILYTDGELVS